jgi:hypothetical protein
MVVFLLSQQAQPSLFDGEGKINNKKKRKASLIFKNSIFFE